MLEETNFRQPRTIWRLLQLKYGNYSKFRVIAIPYPSGYVCTHIIFLFSMNIYFFFYLFFFSFTSMKSTAETKL